MKIQPEEVLWAPIGHLPLRWTAVRIGPWGANPTICGHHLSHGDKAWSTDYADLNCDPCMQESAVPAPDYA